MKKLWAKMTELESKLERPNPEQTWEEMEKELEWYLEMTGNCFMWMIPGKSGETIEVWCVPPHEIIANIYKDKGELKRNWLMKCRGNLEVPLNVNYEQIIKGS